MAARVQQSDPLMVSSQDFLPWGRSQPNKVPNEHCVVVSQLDESGPRKFHDYPCIETFAYICKKDLRLYIIYIC